MSGTVVIELSPQARALFARAATIGPRISEALRAVMDEQNQLTIGHAQRFKLSQRGPTTLGVVTNRLRSSLAAMPAKITAPGVIVSGIGSNVSYAGIHEFGFDGQVTVRAHTRRRFGTIMQSRGATFDSRTGRIRKLRPRSVRSQTGSAQVRQHLRHVRMPARSFIRSSLAERGAAYGRAFSAAIVAAFRGPEAAGPTTTTA